MIYQGIFIYCVRIIQPAICCFVLSLFYQYKKNTFKNHNTAQIHADGRAQFKHDGLKLRISPGLNKVPNVVMVRPEI